MKEALLKQIRAHAAQEFPRESCGVVSVVRGKQRYVPCRNVAAGVHDFQIDVEDLAKAEDEGTVTHIVHSHPNLSPLPSESDLVGCEASGLPWLIVNWPDGHYHEFAPTGYSAPLIGRSFSYGVLDCWALVRDYYQRELGIELINLDRVDGWFLNGENILVDNLDAAGFVEVPHESMRPHDVLLMQVGSPVPNHVAVYIGDQVILQHCMNRLSGREVYGGYWQRCVNKVVRHRSLIDA